ncbi:hypothetical protein M378DRAFT_182065 [Amanita muscaria Koide BX008]|uniref:Uncharacterized protein n=1 Tax=Amanita muscaria (strain Koide BX008) TaxID=946122 RepID=A0A0C2SQ06_AMAMK|nr:hypothetical protein M378DRAFT_182065 [Amanita muscaria Koide BX008]
MSARSGTCPCCGKVLSLITIQRHMAGRGPTMLAGKLLQQNARFTSSNSSARQDQLSQLAAKQELLGTSRKTGTRPTPSGSRNNLAPESTSLVHRNRSSLSAKKQVLGTSSRQRPAAKQTSSVITSSAQQSEAADENSSFAHIQQSSHLDSCLNTALDNRYTRPNNMGEDLESADEDEGEEEDEEEADISCSVGDEVNMGDPSDEEDDEKEDDSPGGQVPAIWNLQEEEFLKVVAELGARASASEPFS